jgi:hypothetical protein
MKIKIPSLCAAAILAFAFHPSFLRAQGSLTPPGAPAPTMKSLDQIEPRTPVDATHTPGTPDQQFTISQPGSYYLTGNITAVSGVVFGILIQANDVTLDLNGFAMTGLGNDDGIVVNVTGVARNIVIRNGTLRNWAIGVDGSGGYCELDHMRACACTENGFYLGDHCIVRGCTVVSSGGTGILGGDNCVVIECLVSSNATGMSCGTNCVVSGCEAATNTLDGIDLGDNFNITKCTSNCNGRTGGSRGAGFNLGSYGQIRQCMANGNNSDGMDGMSSCTVRECIANNNVLGGISMHTLSIITDNDATANGSDGIETFGAGSRIDSNHTFNNESFGIYSNGNADADIIVRNISRDNYVGDYFPTNGTTLGPLLSPATATSPWANF